MVFTVNIPEDSTATIDENNNITVTLLVEIKDGAVVYSSKNIFINVYLYTENILTYAVNQMIEQINRYKNLMIKQQQIQAVTGNFTNLVRAGV